jgi:hypothetical protein
VYGPESREPYRKRIALDSARVVAKYSRRVSARRFFPAAAVGPTVLPLLVLAAGCASADFQKASAARADRARASAVVVIAAPPRSTLWLYRGVDDGTGWMCEGGAGEIVQVSSEGGFVVAKLPPRTGREKYAIGEVAIADGSDRRLRPGANAKVPVFNAVPGKVTLVGGVKVLDVGEGLSLLPDPSATPARAARFLARKDPQVSASLGKGKVGKVGKVGKGRMSWVAMPDSCARR